MNASAQVKEIEQLPAGHSLVRQSVHVNLTRGDIMTLLIVNKVQSGP